jgi:protein-S-isoprenylcysteine O-methyltransferase Ste14
MCVCMVVVGGAWACGEGERADKQLDGTGSLLSPLTFWAYVNFLVVPRENIYMKDKFGHEYDNFAKK